MLLGEMNAKLMDIQARFGIISSHCLFSTSFKSLSSNPSSSSSSSYCWTQRFLCSRRDSDQEKNGNENGDKYSTDWDKAWSRFKKQGKKKKKKKSIFSDFSPNKYVSWNTSRSDYPLSEEVDPIKRTERSNLMLWTSPGFTLAGAIVLVTFLLIYTILAPVK